MLLTEYDEEAVNQLFYEDGYREGFEEGFEEERTRRYIEMIRNVMSSLQVSALAAMEALKIPAEKQEKYLRMLEE